MSTRKDDLRLDVVQHQQEKKLTIVRADADLVQHIDYAAEELVGKDIRQILPASVQELVDQYLEYDQEIPDLAVVLGKVRRFGLLHKKGREIRFSLKILRDVSEAENPCFQLHISRLKVMDSLRQQLGLPEQKEEDVPDAQTGMPGKATFQRQLKVVRQAVAQGKVNACIGLIRIDQYNDISHRLGREAAGQAFKHLHSAVRANLREDDVVAYVEPNRVAVLLLEARVEHAKIPLNRIRWMFAAQPVDLGKEKCTLTLTASYAEITGEGVEQVAMEACQRLLREADLNASNTIIEPMNLSH